MKKIISLSLSLLFCAVFSTQAVAANTAPDAKGVVNIVLIVEGVSSAFKQTGMTIVTKAPVNSFTKFADADGWASKKAVFNNSSNMVYSYQLVTRAKNVRYDQQCDSYFNSKQTLSSNGKQFSSMITEVEATYSPNGTLVYSNCHAVQA